MSARRGMRRAAGVAVAGVGLILIALMFDTGPLFVPGVAFAGLGRPDAAVGEPSPRAAPGRSAASRPSA